MLKHIIPNSIPESDRAEQLERARTSMHHRAVVMLNAAHCGDLRTYSRVKYMYTDNCFSFPLCPLRPLW